MGRHAKAAKYKFEEEEYVLPRLEELSLVELKNVGKLLGLHVTKYNNRDRIVADLYPIVNGLKINEKIPQRNKQYVRVCEKLIMPDHRYEIFSYEGKGAVTGGLATKGVFHVCGRDGYIGASYVPCSEDVLVIDSVIKKYGLLEGDYIVGRYMYYDKLDLLALIDIISVNGQKPGAPRAAVPEVAEPQPPVSVWDDNDAMLRAVDALCAPREGDSLLISHPAKYRSPALLLNLANKWKQLSPETEVIGLYLTPPADARAAIREAGAEVVEGNVPADFAFEAMETACARAELLAAMGKKVLLCVYNLQYATQTGDMQDAVRLLSVPAAYTNGGALTVAATINAEALPTDKLGLLRGFADCELALTADGAEWIPDFSLTGSVHESSEIAALRAKAAQEGNRILFEQVTRL